jgi:urease accessory protein
LQLYDSAFPSGRYTLSHGLEPLAQSGQLTGPAPAEKLFTLVEDCVRHGVGPSDGVALACAHRAARRRNLDLESVLDADARLTATKLARESRAASIRTGRALLRTATAAFGFFPAPAYADQLRMGRARGNHAVVIGLLTAFLEVPLPEAVAGEVHSFAAGWLSAAVRLGLVDHRSAQALLFQIHPVVIEAAQDACHRQAKQISSCTPLLDAMSMRHEQAEVRLFAS